MKKWWECELVLEWSKTCDLIAEVKCKHTPKKFQHQKKRDSTGGWTGNI